MYASFIRIYQAKLTTCNGFDGSRVVRKGECMALADPLFGGHQWEGFGRKGRL